MAVAQGRRPRKRAQDTADDAGGEIEDRTEDVEETADDTTSKAKKKAGGAVSDGRETLMSELGDAVREAALEVLKPVARKATTAAAKLAVTQGPSLVKDKVVPTVTDKVGEAGGAGALVKGLGGGLSGLGGSISDKLPFGGDKEDKDGKGKGKSATGTGRGRRLPVMVSLDVGVPIDVAYDQYTQFEDLPKFMHRVEKIEQEDDTHLAWHENVWGVRRKWDVEITDQIPNDRIAWRSGGGEMIGVVTFHKLTEGLTRVQVTMDFQPKGFLEKTASGMRHSRRALMSDLMRFKAYVEMKNEPTGAWRGEIEDGEVVAGPEDEGREDEGREDEGREDEPRSSSRSRKRKRDDAEEPEDSQDEEFDEPEDEEEERPRRRKGRFSRSSDEDEEGEEEFDDEEEFVDEPEMEEDDEPEAEADEEPEAEEEPEEEAPKRKPRRRTPAKSTASRRK